MQNTKTLRRLCSIAMVLSLLIGMVSVMGALPVAAEETTESWNAGLSVNLGDTAVPTVGTDEFGVFAFGEPTTEASTAAISGPTAVAEKMQFNTANTGSGLLDFKGDTAIGAWEALTCTEKRVADFTATLSYYPVGNETSNWYMGIMVGEMGEFGLSLDNNSANDTGVLITIGSDHLINVAGAVEEHAAENNAPASGLLSKANYFSNTSAIRAKTNNNSEVSWGAAVAATEGGWQTITVTVEGQYLTVWDHATPHLKTVVRLSDNYAGGYVSYVKHSTPKHGTLKSFSVSDQVSEYDYEYDVKIGSGVVPAEIDNDFGVFYFNDPIPENGIEATSRIPSVPSSVMSAGHDGSYGNGLLDFSTTNAASKGWHAMTHTRERVTDFTVTYTYYPVGFHNTHDMGIMIGKMGQFALSKDSDNSNDTGVIVTVDSSGNVYISGAIQNKDSATASFDFSTSVSYIGSTAECLKSRLTANEDGSVLAEDESAGTVYEDTPLTTVSIQVKGQYLRVWNHKQPEYAVTVRLSDKYAGGYVSYLKKGSMARGSLKSIQIRNDAPDKNVVEKVAYPMTRNDTTYAAKLDKDFETYRFNTTGDVQLPANTTETQAVSSGLPSDNLKVHTTHAKSNGWLNFNISAPLNALTYKQRVTNFRAEFTMYPYHSSYRNLGIMFGGEKGVIPVTADGDSTNDTGVFIDVSTEGRLVMAGAIDKTSLSDLNAARCSTTTINATYIFLNNQSQDVSLIPYAQRYNPSTDTTHSSVKEKAYTLVVEVKDRVLTVYIKGQEERQFTVGLTEQYQGGYVSFTAGDNANHMFADFTVEEYTDNRYVVNYAEADNSLGARLDDDFNLYYFTGSASAPETSAAATATNFNGDNSTVGVIAKSGGEFARLETNVNTRYNGFMKITMPSGTNLGALTYTKQRMTDFTAEASFFVYNQAMGIMFGAEQGKMPYVSDDNYKNDAGVMVELNTDGSLTIRGAIDLDSIPNNEPLITKNRGKHQSIVLAKPTADSDEGCIMSYDRLLPSSLPSGVSAAPVDGSEYQLVVQVKNQVLTVYVKGYEDRAFSIGLADTYQGGYVSLYSAHDLGNAFVDFAFTNQGGQWVEKTDDYTDKKGVARPAVTVHTENGYEVDADYTSFYATDDSGTPYYPTRVGFQQGGTATQFYFEGAAADANLTLHAKYTQPTTEPNIGNAGTSINTEKDGLRFVGRLGIVGDDANGFKATLGGKQYTVEKFGMLISTEAGLTHLGHTKEDLEVGIQNQYVKDMLIYDTASTDDTNIYYDCCDTYTDVSVCVLGLGNYPTLPVVARAYVIINIDGESQTFYTDVVTDQYERTAA